MNSASSQAPAFQFESRDPRVAELLKDYPPAVFSEQLYQSIELMERYSIELAVDLLPTLGVIDHVADWRSADELCRLLHFQPRFRFALRWILERATGTGCIEARADEHGRFYRLHHPLPPPDLQRLRAVGLGIDSTNAATLDLLDHAASFYPPVARAEQSGDQSLFGSQGVTLWLDYFNNENLTYAVNNWVSALVAAARLTDRTSLRILEVGAGAGSASNILLRCFAERDLLRRIRGYTITEPNAFFRRRSQRDLQQQFPGAPLEWGGLDLNLPWDSQGITSGGFDLTFAVNVFHVANDLLFSLQQAHAALAPGGWLIIGECVRPYRHQPIYPEMMFQILESFTDVQTDPAFRPNPGFLTAGQWRTAFARGGFKSIEVAPDVDAISEFYPHFFTGAICGQK